MISYEMIFKIIMLLIIVYIIMKTIDEIIRLLVSYESIIDNQKNIIQQIKIDIAKLETKVNGNWQFLSEEVSDIYPAIKYINTEIMYIKNKIE